MEPDGTCQCPTAQDNLCPQPPTFVISLETGSRSIGDDEAEHSTESAGRQRVKNISRVRVPRAVPKCETVLTLSIMWAE